MKMLAVIAILSLTSCAVTPRTPYSCPYPDISEGYAFALPIEYITWKEMMKECAERGGLVPYGCSRHYTDISTPFSIILVRDDLDELGTEEITYHEICHTYETQVLGVSHKYSANHVGWLRL